MAFAHLNPEDCSELTKIRLGQAGDGGYIVPEEILKDIKCMVTFGVNDEDSFERAMYSKLKDSCPGTVVPFYLCDPFCSYTPREGNETFTFLPLGLDAYTKKETQMINWPDFRQTHLDIQDGICLKLDIEFAEWDSFEHLLERDLEGVVLLVIEFHSLITRLDVLEKQKKVLELINKLFHLHHIHPNNNGYIIPFEGVGALPDVIECTYVQKEWAFKNKYTFVPRQEAFPESIDQPCHPGKFEPRIHWWNQKI